MDNPKFWNGQLFINEFSIDFCYNPIDLNILRLFPLSAISLKQISLNQLNGEVEKNDENFECIVFEISAKKMIDRLHTFGYSINQAKEQFEIAKKEVILTQFNMTIENQKKIDSNYPDQAAFETHEIGYNQISNLSFEEFLDACQNIITNHKRRIIKQIGKRQKSIIPREITNQYERYLVCHGLIVFQFQDIINYLRILLENCSNGFKIQYIFRNNYEGMFDSIKSYYNSNFKEKSQALKLGLPTIVIAEGQTDSKYLKFGFELFYPHLMDLFHFWDFSLKLGSAEALIGITQALISSKIPNNIVAIFDNDTVGNRAKNKLISSVDTIPQNLRILTYPELAFAKQYPVNAINSNTSIQNVNYRGCAIEMYFGQEILLDKKNGEFYPLFEHDNQLKFSGKIKKEIQNKFEKKMILSNNSNDFLDLKLIIDHILNSKNNKNI